MKNFHVVSNFLIYMYDFIEWEPNYTGAHWHFSKYLLCSIDERKSRVGTTWMQEHEQAFKEIVEELQSFKGIRSRIIKFITIPWLPKCLVTLETRLDAVLSHLHKLNDISLKQLKTYQETQALFCLE